ncbi:class B sortase [Collinsella sp. zg1085]|nr:class B sortase [Collinsella sp. zg1085]
MISTVLIVLGVVLLLVAAGIFINAQLGYQAAQGSYKKLEQFAVSDDAGDGIPDVNFDELEKINPDVVGWVYVPNTVINYPVVQTDNNETYLSKLFDLSGNGAGSIFMDMDNNKPGMVDQQTTIYGHHMYDGSMFKYIDDTLNQEAFDSVKTVYYITRQATYKLTPLFTMQVEDTYNDARVPNFAGDQTLADYLRASLGQAKAKAADAEARIDQTQQVLTLVTCAGEIIPRTTRAAMVCQLVEVVPRGQAGVAAAGEQGAGEAAAEQTGDAAPAEGGEAPAEGE